MNALMELIHGKGSHVDPAAVVDDLAWELAGRRVTHLPHTIWQQLGHLNFWIDFGLKAIEGTRPKQPEHDYQSWPNADGPADELVWQHETALLGTNLDQMSTLADARASTLSRIVNAKVGSTVESVLWQLVTHNSYHCGQIVTVRQALGAWPPAAGGLTW